MHSVLLILLFMLPMMLGSPIRDCDVKKIDRCASVLYVYGDPDYRVPTTVPEAERFCK